MSTDDIYGDIVDLAGVRVALYFPGERDQVDKSVRKLFNLLDRPRLFPDLTKNRVGKRFTGYSAVHYRISLREETLTEANKRYAAARVELQVASVLMHAWSEVEHDLAYKPLEGALSEDEEAILDELNGLVLAGEIALERLQKAGKERSSISSRTFANHYDLAAYLLDRAAKTFDEPVNDSGLGRVDQLFELLRRLKIDTPAQLSPYLQAMHGNVEMRPLAEQVVDELLAEDPARYKVYNRIQAKYPGQLLSEESHVSLEVGRFMSAWISFERKLRDLTKEDKGGNRFVPTAKDLVSAGILDQHLYREVEALRRLRNQLVHGNEVPPPDLIATATSVLMQVTAQLGRKHAEGQHG